MYFIKFPNIIRTIYKRSLVCDVKTKEKEIFLTFDDGPCPEVTNEVLKILKQYRAKATFFCLGENVKKYPETFNKILQDNHTVGCHSFNHINGWKNFTKNYIGNIKKCDKYFKSKLFRPPYGRITPLQIRKLKRNYVIVLWTVMSGDFDLNISNLKCLNNVLNNTKKGSIILFHDTVKSKEKVLFVLPRVLEYFADKGFKFSALSKEICKMK